MIFCSIGRWQCLAKSQSPIATVVYGQHREGRWPTFLLFSGKTTKIQNCSKILTRVGNVIFCQLDYVLLLCRCWTLEPKPKVAKTAFCVNKYSKAVPLNHRMKCCCVEIQRTKSMTANLMCNVDYFPSWSICRSEVMLWIIQSPKSHWF